MEKIIEKLKSIKGTEEFNILLKKTIMDHEPIEEVKLLEEAFPLETLTHIRDIMKEIVNK